VGGTEQRQRRCGATVLSEHGRESGVVHAGLRQVPRPPIEELLFFPRNREYRTIENLLGNAAAEDFSSIHVLEEAFSIPVRTA